MPAAVILGYLGPIIAALLVLVATFLAIRRRRTAPEKQPLVALFDSLCKAEVKRHEQLFLFIRRIEELEQLERGYRLCTSLDS